MILMSSADCFSKNSFSNTIRLSNCLEPDQDRRSVGPDMGSNGLQKLSADNKNRSYKDKVKGISLK